jgi:hypothetical protein
MSREKSKKNPLISQGILVVGGVREFERERSSPSPNCYIILKTSRFVKTFLEQKM